MVDNKSINNVESIKEISLKSFENLIEKYSNNIIKQYDNCLNRLNNKKKINRQLNSLNNMLVDLYSFIRKVEKNNKNLLLNASFNDIVLRAYSFIHEIDNNCKELKERNNNLRIKLFDTKKEENSKVIKKKKIKSNPDIDEYLLLDKYLKRLIKGKGLILKLYPNMDRFIDNTIKYLTNINLKKDSIYKGDIRVILDNIKVSLIEQFNYNIDNNTIKRVKNVDNNSNKYIPLLIDMDNYIRDYESKKDLIINNLLAVGTNKDRFNNYNYYKDILYNLSIEVINQTRSVNDIMKDFNITKIHIFNNLGYKYIKSNKRYRRR